MSSYGQAGVERLMQLLQVSWDLHGKIEGSMLIGTCRTSLSCV